MNSKLNHSILALTVLAVLSGCASEPTDENRPEKVNGTMNQPKVEKLVVVDESAPKAKEQTHKIKDSTQPKKLTYIEQQKQKPQPLHENTVLPENGSSTITVAANDSDMSKTSTPLIITNWQAQGKTKVVRTFKLREGDTFAETIANWLGMEGYKSVNTNLTKQDGFTFDVDIDHDDVYVTHFTDALDRLSRLIQHQGIDSNTRQPRSYRIYIGMNKQDQSAIIRSIRNSFDINQLGEVTKPQTVKQSYTIFKGEEYQTALARWTYDAGYQKFGTLYDPEEKLVMKLKSPQTVTFNEPFDTAATKLIYQVSQQALVDERDERNGFISEQAKSDIELHLTLNTLKHEAVITSSTVPVTMFTVLPGSLRDNFLRLANDFNWKADKENYLTKDYWVSFSYPIVAEQNNFKSALTELLKDYSTLKGGMVPSTRQAYVYEEE